LRRFSDRFGADALFDKTGRVYRDAGLGYLTLADDASFEKLMRDQRLIRLPLVRAGSRLSVGPAENDWRAWLRGSDQ
jgi:arsenate reductase-like glutaredoxin family protein